MKKTAFLFPGQGSQKIGMGKDLYKRDSYFRELIEYASEITSENLRCLCQNGPENKLLKSQYLQPSLTALSLALHRHIRNSGINADAILGHSLGEITAMCVAGVLDDKLALDIAVKRGELMDRCAEKCNGGMMAVLFMSIEKVKELLKEINEPDHIALANDNAPNQVILSGSFEKLDCFSELVESRKLGKCRRVVVSGPWHSHFIEPGQKTFAEWVESIIFKKPHTSLIMNATAEAESVPDKIKELSIGQLTKPVYWRECMNKLKTMNINIFLEIGPGRILSGLIRANKFPGKIKAYNIDSLDRIEKAAESILE